jgi:ABC-type multidrug transport system permease subunit
MYGRACRLLFPRPSGFVPGRAWLRFWSGLCQGGNGSYLQFVAPGVIGMTVLFSSVFSGIAMLWDRQFGFLKETLIAPVPRIQIMLGRTLGGATVAVIQGLLILVVCLIAGFRRNIGWQFRDRFFSLR